MKRMFIVKLVLFVAIASFLSTNSVGQTYQNQKNNAHLDNFSSEPSQHRQNPPNVQSTFFELNNITINQATHSPTDWDARWQELVVDSQPNAQDSVVTTPVRVINNRVIVPVFVKLKRRKVQLNLLLDTGASITLLHEQSIKKLKIGKTRTRRASLADGSTVDIDVAKVSELTVGPISLLNTPIAIIENQGRRHQTDGLLGLDVLRHHPFNIDYQNQLIIWQ